MLNGVSMEPDFEVIEMLRNTNFVLHFLIRIDQEDNLEPNFSVHVVSAEFAFTF